MTDSNEELIALQEQANELGIKFHPATGAKKLQAKIDNFLAEDEKEEDNKIKDNKVNKTDKVEVDKDIEPYLSPSEFRLLERQRLRKNASSLMRVRVTCMNPNKKGWEGEIISVGSAKLGTFKKYVPFNAEEGWHIPVIMYEAMKERKFTTFYTVKGPRGQKIKRGKLMPEFSIEVLPALTTEELKELAQRQAMEKGEG